MGHSQSLVHGIIDTIIRFTDDGTNLILIFSKNTKSTITATSVNDYILIITTTLSKYRPNGYFYLIFTVVANSNNCY